MIICIDASAAVQFALNPEEFSRIGSVIVEANYVVTPHLYIYECTNTIWKYVQFVKASPKLGYELLHNLKTIPDEFIFSEDAHELILRIAIDHSISAYDSAYLQVALWGGAILLSLDKKLISAAEALDVEVMQIT